MNVSDADIYCTSGNFGSHFDFAYTLESKIKIEANICCTLNYSSNLLK